MKCFFFYLYNYYRGNTNTPKELRTNDISSLSPFNPKLQTKVLIHGFTHTSKSESVILIKDGKNSVTLVKISWQVDKIMLYSY